MNLIYTIVTSLLLRVPLWNWKQSALLAFWALPNRRENTRKTENKLSTWAAIASRGNANAEECPKACVDSDNEELQRNWTKVSGINLHSLSDWIDCSIFLTVWQRACPKRIITTRLSVSIFKMPKVHPMGCDAVFGVYLEWHLDISA